MSIQTFKALGVNFEKQSTDQTQSIADCIFCGKGLHFFVNNKTDAWDCKVCGKKGGINDFLKEFYKDILSTTSYQKLLKLAKYRNLPLSLLQNYKIAFDDDKYYLPIYNNNDKIIGLRYYEIGKKTKSVIGTKVGIYNLPNFLNEKNIPVYITEGEFDCLTLNWLLEKAEQYAIAISICGVGQFKGEYVNYFLNNPKIRICFDKDDAGDKAALDIKEKLKGFCKQIELINWSDEFPNKYDVSDFVTAYGIGPNKPLECFSRFKKFFEKKVTESKESKIYPDKKLFLKDIIAEYSKTLQLSKNYIDAIKVTLATILSIKIAGTDPLWLFLVGPPGYGKTAILSPFSGSTDHAYFQSSLSAKSLVSGFNHDDASLIPKLDGKCLILKDYTEILGKSPQDKEVIFSILRGAFDGTVERDFGNGIIKRYVSRFSILAGVTNQIKANTQGALGERFLHYSMVDGNIDHNKQQDKALFHALFGESDRDELKQILNTFLSQERDFSKETLLNLIPNWFLEKLKPLARIVAHLRTPVIRHERGIKYRDPIYKPEPSSGNREAIQLQRLAIALAVLEEKKQIDNSIYNIIKKIAWDSISGYSREILSTLVGIEPQHLTRSQIYRTTNISKNTLYIYLEDLEMLNLVERGPPKSNNVVTYRTKKHINFMWKKAELHV